MPPRRRRVRRQDVVAITHTADSRRNRGLPSQLSGAAMTSRTLVGG